MSDRDFEFCNQVDDSKKGFRPAQLSKSLSKNELEAIRGFESVFPFRITSEYASLIDWSNQNDPLRKQVVPTLDEFDIAEDESKDPLEESRYMPIPGIIHKYEGRIVWLITNTCPIHCRFCFRRWKWKSELTQDISENDIDLIVQYLNRHPSVYEVIFSGGDPFMVDQDKLNACLKALDRCSTVRLIRFHTRLPIVASDDILAGKPLYKGHNYTSRVVIHINHSNEISPGFKKCVLHWQKQRISVLTQTVLLAGINDTEDNLFDLFFQLAELGVQPYYLHYPDAAAGTGHFRIPVDKAIKLSRYLMNHLPGYAVPKLVRDIPGRAAKTII